jgi:hypothetical protein
MSPSLTSLRQPPDPHLSLSTAPPPTQANSPHPLQELAAAATLVGVRPPHACRATHGRWPQPQLQRLLSVGPAVQKLRSELPVLAPRCGRRPGACQAWWWSSASRRARCSASSATPSARASCWRRSAAARPALARVGLRGARRSCSTRRRGTRSDGRQGERGPGAISGTSDRPFRRLVQATDTCSLDIGLSNR